MFFYLVDLQCSLPAPLPGHPQLVNLAVVYAGGALDLDSKFKLEFVKVEDICRETRALISVAEAEEEPKAK